MSGCRFYYKAFPFQGVRDGVFSVQGLVIIS
jgi:hypothetical protein